MGEEWLNQGRYTCLCLWDCALAWGWSTRSLLPSVVASSVDTPALAHCPGQFWPLQPKHHSSREPTPDEDSCPAMQVAILLCPHMLVRASRSEWPLRLLLQLWDFTPLARSLPQGCLAHEWGGHTRWFLTRTLIFPKIIVCPLVPARMPPPVCHSVPRFSFLGTSSSILPQPQDMCSCLLHLCHSLLLLCGSCLPCGLEFLG